MSTGRFSRPCILAVAALMCCCSAWAGSADVTGATDQQPPAVARVAYPAGSPGLWLSYAGKSDGWYADTQRCRELLAGLDVNDASVKRYVPRIREKAEILGRVNGFDWRTRTAVAFLQGMIVQWTTRSIGPLITSPLL